MLLYEDGVYAALKGAASEEKIKSAMQNRKVCALGPDLKARGFSQDRVIDGVSVIDYAGFVDLAVEAEKVQAWV